MRRIKQDLLNTGPSIRQRLTIKQHCAVVRGIPVTCTNKHRVDQDSIAELLHLSLITQPIWAEVSKNNGSNSELGGLDVRAFENRLNCSFEVLGFTTINCATVNADHEIGLLFVAYSAAEELAVPGPYS